MPKTGRLTGMRAIVTGASAGIGETIAKTLGREGAAVAVVGRNTAEAKRVAGEVEAAGGEAMVVQADVTSQQDVEAMAQAVLARWGAIDILVNGAGGWQKSAPITEIRDEEWDDVINLNLRSAFLCVRAVAKSMIEHKRGRIINIGSASGIGPNPITNTNLAYACAKGGLIVFTRHLAKQLGPHGITVNTVSPGTTLTPRVKDVWDSATVEMKAALNPLRCLVDPEDSANAVLFLVSDEGRHITGVNLNVNAGAAMI